MAASPSKESTQSPARACGARRRASRCRCRERTFWEDKAVTEFFETSGRNLQPRKPPQRRPSCGVVGCRHRRACSRAVTFARRWLQENLIKASPIPYTIVRATQFFEFMGGIAGRDGRADSSASSGSDAAIAADDVAAVMADVAVDVPLNGTFDLAGPQPIRQDELVRHS